jgi:hypothetical protein
MLKKILLILILVIGGILIFTQKKDENRLPAPSDENAQEGKLKAANFSGKLEEVNTGCFADAECYVVVDGKHITAIMGWSQETVGTVQGVEGFGDLENHIGKEVEVYAQDTSDGKYTLYGSEGFYIKLK